MMDSKGGKNFFREDAPTWTKGERYREAVSKCLLLANSDLLPGLEDLQSLMSGRIVWVFTLLGHLIDLGSRDRDPPARRLRSELNRIQIYDPDPESDLISPRNDLLFQFFPFQSPIHWTEFLKSQVRQAFEQNDSPITFIRDTNLRDLVDQLRSFQYGMECILQACCPSDEDAYYLVRWAHFAGFALMVWNRSFSRGSFPSSSELNREWHSSALLRFDPALISPDRVGSEFLAALRVMHSICPVCWSWGFSESFCRRCMFSSSPGSRRAGRKRPFLLGPDEAIHTSFLDATQYLGSHQHMLGDAFMLVESPYLEEYACRL